MRVAAWRIEDGSPVRTQPSSVQFEHLLESWIESDPELVGQGLRIVGRQLRLEAGRLDLLAVDPAGRWVVIEIKAGALYRETIAQALDYASSLAALSEDRLRSEVGDYLCRTGALDTTQTLDQLFELGADTGAREIGVMVVGTGTDPALERVARYLTETYGVPIRAVAFEVLDLGEGQQLLLREVTESDELPEAARSPSSVASVLEIADGVGAGQAMRTVLEAAERNGLYARAYKRSVMITPPSNKTRMLFTMWAQRGGNLYSSGEAFSEFFPLTEAVVREAIGPDGWRSLDEDTAEGIAAGLDELLGEGGDSGLGPTPPAF